MSSNRIQLRDRPTVPSLARKLGREAAAAGQGRGGEGPGEGAGAGGGKTIPITES